MSLNNPKLATKSLEVMSEGDAYNSLPQRGRYLRSGFPERAKLFWGFAAGRGMRRAGIELLG